MSDDADDPEAPFDTAVPAAFTHTRPKRVRESRQLAVFDFEELKGKHVEVRASGYRYTGTLVGADENELYLKGLTRWWVLPLDRVADVRPLSDAPSSEGRVRRRGPIPGDPDPSAEGPAVLPEPPDDDAG